MEPTLTVNITLDELKIIIKELISEYMLDHAAKSKRTKSDLFSHAEILEKLYIRPQRLEEYKRLGLINEYPVGNTVKFKISELFAALNTLLTEARKENQKQKEVSHEQSV